MTEDSDVKIDTLNRFKVMTPVERVVIIEGMIDALLDNLNKIEGKPRESNHGYGDGSGHHNQYGFSVHSLARRSVETHAPPWVVETLLPSRNQRSL